MKSFFMMDENFLLHKRRAMELLDCMKAGRKAWALYVFSSANAIRQYTMRELVELGVSWIWMGLESPRSAYTKLKGADTLTLTARAAAARHQAARARRSSGWSTTRRRTSTARSSTPSRTIPISTSSCSTRRCRARRCTRDDANRGGMLTDVDLADIHGQASSISRTRRSRGRNRRSLLDWAFRRDFERNGPSIFRLSRR